MNNFIKNTFNIAKSHIKKQDIKFFPCPREPCYCKMVVNYPKHTIITSDLIKNTHKCRDEYYTIQRYVNRENPRD
tara:strand:- start:1146 stop:1370 length:225 start_codon:yes stop_codon:yes gene_type:complete